VTAAEAFRRALCTSGAVMLVGIGMLIATAVLQSDSIWWTRMAALLTVSGAILELLPVCRYLRSRS
jgi:hypothetical protein